MRKKILCILIMMNITNMNEIIHIYILVYGIIVYSWGRHGDKAGEAGKKLKMCNRKSSITIVSSLKVFNQIFGIRRRSLAVVVFYNIFYFCFLPFTFVQLLLLIFACAVTASNAHSSIVVSFCCVRSNVIRRSTVAIFCVGFVFSVLNCST